MTGERFSTATIDSAYEALVNRHPGATVAAIGPDGFRVPIPSGHLEAHASVPLPPDRATMLDLVVGEDQMSVIQAWESATAAGMSRVSIRMTSAPHRYTTLSFMDLRHRDGVFLAVITEDDAPRPPGADANAPEPSMEPLRPRTATLTKSMHAIITDLDERAERMLGFSREELLGRRSSDFIHPEDQQRAVANWMELLSRKTAQRVRVRHRRQDGSWFWVEIENVYAEGPTPEDIAIHTQLNDISDEMAAHEAVRQREELFRRLAESLPIGLLQVQLDGSIHYANDRLRNILGVANARTLDEQLSTVADEERDVLDTAFRAVLDGGQDQALEVAVRLPQTGELRRCAVTMTALTSREGSPGALATVNDITESSRLREELRIKATYDTLTGCHNRASVMALLEARLDEDRFAGTSTAVVFIDLDHFKPINDQLGHAAGDELLVVAASRLRDILREGDWVGRIGGDEFLLVCHGAGAGDKARKLAARVHEALHHSVVLKEGVVELAGSIGIAVSTPGLTADQIVAYADAAMYESKRLGNGTPVLHDGERNVMLR